MLTSPKFQPELAAFRLRWTEKLEESVRAFQDGDLPLLSVWEGFEASRELHQKDDLFVVGITDEPEMKFLFDFLTDKLFREVQLYEWYSKRVIPTNKGFKKAAASLPVILRKIRSIESGEPIRSLRLSHELKRCSSIVETALNEVRKSRETYWKNALFATTAERGTWSFAYETLEDAARGRRSEVLPEELVKHEKSLELSLERINYSNDLTKRTNLDARFQKRVAIILRSYLPAHPSPPSTSDVALQAYLGPKFGTSLPVSLKTISRLVMLTYLAGQLGHEDSNGQLIVDGRKKPVTVVGIDQALRDAGVE